MFILTYLFFIIILLLLSIIGYLAKRRSTYWTRQNIPNVNILPIFGNLKDVILRRRSAFDIMLDVYFHKKIYNQPIAGFQFMHKPALLILEPELIKRILIKDFNKFSNRSTKSNLSTDKIGATCLFLARQPLWNEIRARLTPIFSSGKIKKMFYLIDEVGDQLQDVILNLSSAEQTIANDNSTSNITGDGVLDCTETFHRYVCDIISCCTFGLKENSLHRQKSMVWDIGEIFFNFTLYRSLEFMSFFLIPELIPIFKFKFFPTKMEHHMRTSLMKTIDERAKSGIIKNDLIDALIRLKNEDLMRNREIVFDDDVLIAQAGLFIAAGFEPSSVILSFIIYELSMNQSIQKRLRDEIKLYLKKYNNKLTYEMVKEMEYLSMIVQEAARLYPTIPFLDRQCELSADDEPYSLEPYSDYKISHGTIVIIPNFAIQRDPKYFIEPNTFDPERFSATNKQTIQSCTNLTFGEGPHNCIGQRMAMQAMKCGIINVLRNHYVEPIEGVTPKKLNFDNKTFTMRSASNIKVKVIKDPLYL